MEEVETADEVKTTFRESLFVGNILWSGKRRGKNSVDVASIETRGLTLSHDFRKQRNSSMKRMREIEMDLH